MKIIRIIFISIFLLFFILWIISYTKNEILTIKYGTEFVELYKMTNMIDDLDKLKVLFYSNEIAHVYYFDIYSGNILEFLKINDKWEMTKWSTVWSKTGSADNFKWPYIYHSAEGKAILLFIGILFFGFISFIVINTDNISKNRLKK